MNYNYSYEQTIYTSAYFNRIIDSELSKTPFYTKIIEDYKKVTKDPKAIYFGDDNDDVEPIRHCGCGVAMSNALDHVKAAADYITESNDEDGVARFLVKQIS